MTRTEASNKKRELLESSMMEVVVVKMRTGRPREKREKGSRVYVCVGEREGEEETTGLLSAALLCIFLAGGGGSTALTDALARSGAAPTTATNSGPSSPPPPNPFMPPHARLPYSPGSLLSWLSLALMRR